MEEQNAESITQSARGTQIGAIEGTDYADREGRIAEVSRFFEHFDLRDFRAAGPGATGWLVGGILTRIVEDKLDRVREAEECIEWYEREKQKRLEELEALQSLVERFQSEES